MGLFDSIQNLISGATDLAQGSIGEVVGGVTDNPIVQDLQDQATTITDGASETLASVQEQGQASVEDVTNNLGL